MKKRMYSLDCFLPSDLIHYIEMLLRESLREPNNYSWLKSRHIQSEVYKFKEELDKLTPIAQKMTSERCAKIAVKLDTLTVGVYSSAAILSTFKKLLLEQHSIQLLESNLKSSKKRKKNRHNRVLPESMPEERQPTISFIL